MSTLSLGIAGYGRFGRALAQLAHARRGAYALAAFDPHTTIDDEGVRQCTSLEELVLSSEVLIVATPVHVMRDVFEDIARHVGAAPSPPFVMDVGSVKVAPARAMAKALTGRCRHVATHPLFGPSSLARAERPLEVIVCPSPIEEDTAHAERFWQTLGCETRRVSAEDHDRVMARTHALAFFFAKGMIDASLADVSSFAPPSFKAMARSVDAVRADAGHLYRTIEVDNPFAAEARSALLAALSAADADLTREAGQADAARISIAPHDAAWPGGASALNETRELIDEVDRELVRLLARRAALAERALHEKNARGLPTRDPAREADVLASRRAWAHEQGLDEERVADVFSAILRFSRAHQSR